MDSEIKSFSQFNFYPWIVRLLHSIGIKTPTPVQVNCIPAIMQGKDCIGAAKTGSGKTLAFALPIIQKLCEEPYGIFALVLTPTRELALQIADQFAVMGRGMNLRHCVIIGGMDMIKQGRELSNNPHIVVATPGRLVDHIEGCQTFSLSKIKYLVVDEADRLLGGGFNEQIKTIFKQLPKRRQNLFFSATITDTLKQLKEAIPNEVFVYEAPADVATVEELEQNYVLCPQDVKDAYLVQVVRDFREKDENGNILIFCDTCKNCQLLSMTLNEVGFENMPLHSMIKQKQRIDALTSFKSKSIKILVATDVVARGLDIPAVQLVINYNITKIPAEYVHRVGRTARAGRRGKAVSLVTPNDIKLLQNIEKFIKMQLTEMKVDDNEVAIIFAQVSLTKSEAGMKLDEQNFYEKRVINRRKKWLMDGLDPDEEEAKLLKKFKKHKSNKVK